MNEETSKQIILELIKLALANAITLEDYEVCQVLMRLEEKVKSDDQVPMIEEL